MSFVYQVRRDTAANWTAANPTLLQGEWALETDTHRAKLGDGVTAWSSLAYFLADEISAAVAAVIDGAPGALNTLNELAAALDDDASFAATITNALAAKAALDSPTFTGTPAAPTAAPGTDSTQIATTGFVTAALASVDTGPVVSVSSTQPGSFDGGDLWLDTSATV